MDNPISEHQLVNGLQIKLKEIHTAPIVSHWLWYRVGSRDELPGKTGVSHWVEHMQFKGTEQFPATVLDKAISREGGFWNAFTNLDWTTFYETLPADKIDLALRLEADRMCNSTFKPEEVDAERTVIISEREGSENEPLFRLSEAIQNAAFDRHPYHYEVIGELEDLKKMTRDDLYGHYRKHYLPNNAVLTMAGDLETDVMLKRLEELYAQVKAGVVPPHPAQHEAPLKSERHVEVKGPGETLYLQVAYRAPAANSTDFFVMTVLDSILTGPTGLNMFGGGGISNKTSRLYRALVEKGLATSLSGGMQATIDPFLYDINVTVQPQRTPEEILDTIEDEIKRLQDTLLSSEEIARAIKQARALFAYGSENITNQAFWMGYAEMFAKYEWFSNYVSNLEQVTPQDIQTTARVYLNPARRVTGIYVPEPGKEAA